MKSNHKAKTIPYWLFCFAIFTIFFSIPVSIIMNYSDESMYGIIIVSVLSFLVGGIIDVQHYLQDEEK